MTNYLEKMELNITLGYIKAGFLSLMFFIPIWYAFETQYANPALLGTIYAVAHLVTVVLELPTGALADLLGRKKTIFLGLLLTGLSWIYISQMRNVMWLWSGYFINAVGNALVSGADVALIFDSLKELGKDKKYAQYMSKAGLIFRSGMVVSTFLGGYFYILHQRLPYFLVGTGVVVAALLTIFNTEPKIDTEKFTLRLYIKQTKLGLKELTKNSYIRDFTIYYLFVGGISWYFIYFLGQSFATEIGFTVKERSWIFSGIYLLMAIFSYLLIRSKLLTRSRAYLMFPTIMILGLLPGFWMGKLLSVLCIFLVQFAGTNRFSILDQYANEEFESQYRATAISALNMGVSVVFSIISIAAGKIISLSGPGLVMTLIGILTIITTLPTTRVLLAKHNGRN